jgi:methionyl-tRNA formyltransferase
LEITATNNYSQIRTFYCPARSLNFPFNWSDYSVGIVSSFSLFIPSQIIKQIPLINIHPSLLPQWRGPAPIQYTILNGQERTGVSIIDLHPKIIDAGSILAQEHFNIPPLIKYHELEDELAELGGKMAAQVLSSFDDYWVNRREQDDFGVSRCRKISKSDGIISFKTDSFELISRKVRAFSHQIPIKTVDLIPNKEVILEDILLDIPMVTTKTAAYYDKSTKTVVFIVQNRAIGVKQFKIEGKSQIFPAGSFHSNYLKNLT